MGRAILARVQIAAIAMEEGFDDLDALRAALDGDARAVFCESYANPGGYVTDIPAIAGIADEAGVPLIVDNTLATPWLCRPIEAGATLVVHSLTKYLTGNGTVTGGAVIDSGRFDWSASDKFPSLSAPEPAYHGLKFHETFGAAAFTFHGIAIGLRDLGMTLNPQAAHYTLMGVETLALRMPRHLGHLPGRELPEYLRRQLAALGLKPGDLFIEVHAAPGGREAQVLDPLIKFRDGLF